MKSSVIVSTRNRLQEVIRFLQSLIKQIELPDELIVVDSSICRLDNSNQFKSIFELCARKNIRTVLVYSQPGLTYQRNVGILRASGDVIYFFDDDVVLNEDYIFEMNKLFREKTEYAGGMGSVVDAKVKWSINRLLRVIFLMQREKASGKFTFSGMPTHAYGRKDFCEVKVLGGCCMAFRREVFNHFKFDENLRFYSYMEDCDFSKRISQKYKLFYNPQAILDHLHSPLGRDKVLDNRAMYIENYSYLFFKNFYPENRLRLLGYFWTVLGLFLETILIRDISSLKGYLKGLVSFMRCSGKGEN